MTFPRSTPFLTTLARVAVLAVMVLAVPVQGSTNPARVGLLTGGRAARGPAWGMGAALSAILFLVGACGTASGPASAPEAAAAAAQQTSAAESYLTIPLRDVRGGATFTLGGFAGKVVLVEGMAVWCPLCTEQQRNIRTALGSFGSEVVAVSLDIDPNENEEILRRHAERNGFGWRFAVAPPSIANALAASFGTRFLDPPSTPLVIIDARGAAHTTASGIKSAEEIRTLVERYR